jgi:hypothetical protein
MWFYGEGVYLPLFVEYAPAYRTAFFACIYLYSARL